MGTIVRETIYDWQIGRLFLPGPGETAWNWMERAGREQMYHTLRLVPRRTGALAASHNLALTPSGPLNVRYTIGSYSDVAHWVVFGTTGPIRGRGNWTDDDGNKWMLVRPWPASWFLYPTKMAVVDGQDENNYFWPAAMFMLAKYG